MLAEERRKQLDDIVLRMSSNKETPDTIQFVVNDFKAKYDNEVPTPVGERGLKGVGVGIAKGALQSVQGLGQLGLRGAEMITGKEKGALGSQETFFRDPSALEAEGTAEKIGKFGERVAEFAVPLTKVSQATQGANFLTRLAAKVATAGGVASAQTGEVGKETVIAGSVEGLLPVVGKVARPVFNIVRRLVKGLGSGLSGVGTDVIDTIVRNPQTALEISKKIEKEGTFAVLEENAKTIVNGVSKVRQEARSAYGKGLEALKAEDISSKQFRAQIQPVLDKFGSTIKDGKRILQNVEFTESKNLQKASELIGKLSNAKLDGKSLRKLADDIENAKFKIATSDERLAFNAFTKDLSQGLTKAINESTDKLKEINKVFSADMQLVEGIERIFGKIKFKSLAEIDKVAQKLEALFSQKGLNPREIDNFLDRIGITAEDFRTSEGIRQIGIKTTGANTKGLTITEIVQQLTSSILTPNAIKNAAIFTGLSEPTIKELLEAVAPSARGALIELLIQEQQ